ncbi:hypothetical protein FB451DRAFT_1571143 [Mycena latifolia]|nr:hypothetical protein FB451DRAFT_1571143 [Mycena latifolia]
MPLYEVWHSYPLAEAQRADLAQRITAIHTTLFTVPAAFVHVRFANYVATEHYTAGKKRTGTINLVLANVRSGAARTRDLYESLCRQIEAAWTASVGDPATQGGAHARLTGAFVLGTVTISYKQGFTVPEAGQEVEWTRENLLKFQALADDGNEFCRDMIAELRTREDFQSVFENRKRRDWVRFHPFRSSIREEIVLRSCLRSGSTMTSMSDLMSDLYPFLYKTDVDGSGEDPEILSPEVLQCMNRVMGEYHRIDYLGTGVRSIKIPDVSREAFEALEQRGYEEGNYRLEYYSDSRVVVASRQSNIHVAYQHLFHSLQDIARVDKDYRVRYNTTIQRHSPWAYLTPDLSILYWPLRKHFLILECGWAQSSAEGAKSTRREASPEAGYTMKRWADIDFLEARTPLSPVVFEDHTWSAGIDKIVMTIYHREHTTETFDVTPVPAGDALRADALAAAQNRINSYLGSQLIEFMTRERFKKLFSEEQPFGLDWDDFYEELDSEIQSEAFDRYRTWAWSHGLREGK